MFTGLIEEIGRIESIIRRGENLKITLQADKVLKGAVIGDSIAVNGVCLTATSVEPNRFSADVMPETWRRSRLKELKSGEKVNLEKSLTPGTPLGGHLVYGDVDCEGEILSVKSEGIATLYRIGLTPHWMRYVALKGRVAIDGASLTVMQRDEESFTVSLIPHSSSNLILGNMKSGDRVNIETDIIAKYTETLLGGPALKPQGGAEQQPQSGLTMERLQENGFF